jgi:hypothetical protein
MAAKKKETDGGGTFGTAGAEDKLILVNAKKLSQGLRTTFEGVSMVFDSLGVDCGFPMGEVVGTDDAGGTNGARDAEVKAKARASTKTKTDESKSELAERDNDEEKVSEEGSKEIKERRDSARSEIKSQTDGAGDAGKPEKPEPEKSDSEKPEPEKPEPDKCEPSEAAVEGKEASVSVEDASKPNASKPNASETVRDVTTSITADDITRVIVQKIKQKRSNNEKIGSILKSYGVVRVGELPASKYEAFLTDLAAI